jgi:hypothetical protein
MMIAALKRAFSVKAFDPARRRFGVVAVAAPLAAPSIAADVIRQSEGMGAPVGYFGAQGPDTHEEIAHLRRMISNDGRNDYDDINDVARLRGAAAARLDNLKSVSASHRHRMMAAVDVQIARRTAVMSAHARLRDLAKRFLN